jgi:hypothetical protein
MSSISFERIMEIYPRHIKHIRAIYPPQYEVRSMLDPRFAPCFYLECEVIVPLKKILGDGKEEEIVSFVNDLYPILQDTIHHIVAKGGAKLIHPGSRKYKYDEKKPLLSLKITTSFSCNAVDAMSFVENVTSETITGIKNCVYYRLGNDVEDAHPIIGSSNAKQIGCFDTKEHAAELWNLCRNYSTHPPPPKPNDTEPVIHL